jgi:hypothetical protein
MKRVSVLLALLPILACDPAVQPNPRPEPEPEPENRFEIEAGADLQQAIDDAPDGATLVLAAGTYEATPRDYTDPTCGNCQDDEFETASQTTVGLHVTGKSIHLEGPEATLVTGAGYGLLFERAGTSSITGLTITGGVRGPDGKATEAAIVLRETALEATGILIDDYDDLSEADPDPVVGLIGIAVREGGDLLLEDSQVLNTSWDGVALYRTDAAETIAPARATIRDSVVACTRDCTFQAGRGVGIGVTWQGSALLERVEVAGSWKGVGAFGDTRVELYNSVVRDSYGWGVAVTETAELIAENNVILDHGTTGFGVLSQAATGRFVNNVVTGSGWNDEWVLKRTGIWRLGRGVDIRFNAMFDNAPFDACGDDCADALELEDNLTVDPELDAELRPAPGSPLIDAGDPEITDVDGSRSDIGLTGGPRA